MNYDGKVIISTALDNSGLEKGVNNISGSFGGLKSVLGKLTGMIATAFSVTAVVQFGVESSKAAMSLENALLGLQSIVEGQGRSFSKAKTFIEEYTKDGLIPATNAITAYKNLASRGYDDSQIKQVMISLKDASTFGRQASMSMGEAVQSATEGLKNENSILVDNAGVTKNVAKMWDEYARSIGTTANKLTQQQKIQAEVAGILEESKYQAGDAAKVTQTLSGQLQQLSFNFNNLKVAVGNVINPIAKVVIPVFNAAIVAITRFANTLAAVSAAFFGGTAESVDSYTVSVKDAADAEEDLADGISSASKAAKKALAGFDELNVLQDKSSSGSAAGGNISVGDVQINGNVDDQLTEQVEGTSAYVQKIIEKIQDLIEPLKSIDLTPAKEAFSRLGDAISNFGGIIAEKLEWAWYNILVPLAEWYIEDAVPAALDLWSAAFNLLGSVIQAVWPLLETLWDYFLAPIAEWTGGVIVSVLDGITGQLNGLANLINPVAEMAYTFSDAEKELAKSAQLAAENFSALQDATAKEEGAITKEIGYYSNLAKELDGLVTAQGKVAEKDEARVKFILNELKEGLGIEAKLIGGIVTGYEDLKKSILETIAAKKAELLLKAHEDDYLAALEAQQEAWDQMKVAETAYLAQREQYIKKQEEVLADIRMSGDQKTKIIEAEKKALTDMRAAYDDALSNYKTYTSTINSYEMSHQKILEGNYEDAAELLLNKNADYTQHADHVESETERAMNALKQELADAERTAEQTKFGFEHGIVGFTDGMVAETNDAVSEAKRKLLEFTAESTGIGSGIGGNLAEGMDLTGPQVSSAANTLLSGALSVMDAQKEKFKEIGQSTGDLYAGSLSGAVSEAAEQAKKALQKIQSWLSPSKSSGGSSLSSFTPAIASTYSLATADIPYLAKGSVIPPNAPFMAVLGDQRHGTNVEAPLSTIQEAVAAVMQDYNSANMAGHEATVAVLREILEAVLGIEISDSTIAGAVERYNRKMAVVRGG